MTYYEWLKDVIEDEEQVAHYLCNLSTCETCPADEFCKVGRNGFAVMLDNDCGGAVMEKILTADVAYDLHIAMWSDMQKQLGDNPTVGERALFKEKWCKEKFPGKVVTNHCFLCEYTSQQRLECDECPVEWHEDCRGDVNYACSPISKILALPKREDKE